VLSQLEDGLSRDATADLLTAHPLLIFKCILKSFYTDRMKLLRIEWQMLVAQKARSLHAQDF